MTGFMSHLHCGPGAMLYTVAAQGFDRSAKRLQIDVSQRAAVDFDLKVGTLTQEVQVVDTVPVLQTETATLSNLRTEKSISDLPLNGRNFAQLLQLSAGVMPAQTQQTGSPITMKRGVTGNAVNGTRLEENNYLVDGISNTENHNGLGILIFPSVDAIAEFRVEASVSDAQFGRGGGGTVNLIYKSGTKDFHGNLYEFFRNSALDAKNYFDRATDPIPPFKQNQFGGTLGGPLLPWAKDKNTFFFVSYEGTRVRQAQTHHQYGAHRGVSSTAISRRRRSASSIRSRSGRPVRINSPAKRSRATAFQRTASVLSDRIC